MPKNFSGIMMLCANQLVSQFPDQNSGYVPEVVRRDADIHIHGDRHVTTQLSGPDAPERQELEQFIRNVFHRAYGANIKQFMPQLMSLRDGTGNLLAVCGLRNAGDDALFLESYLDAPVEEAISDRIRNEVARDDIVEIGNLAVAEPGVVRQLLASVSAYLHRTNTQWAVFTAIPVLRNSMIKLNMPLEILASADISRIEVAERPSWGSYYDKNPQVMALKRVAPPVKTLRDMAA
jgi:Thermostable hemolysin